MNRARALAQVGILAAGVPESPAQLWIEDFERATPPAQLGGYDGGRYTAAPFWLNYANCNGVILSYTVAFPASGYCGTTSDTVSRNQVHRMADVLGQSRLGVVGGTTDATPVNGSTATSQGNRAVTAMTMAGGQTTANQVLVESVAPLGLSAPAERYYVASIDVAEDSCNARPGGATNNSRLDMALVVNGAPSSLTARPIVACDATGGRYTSPALPGGFGSETSVRAGRFFGDTAARLAPAEAAAARIRVTNQISASAGNDFAFDNLRVVDATPSLDWAFSRDTVPAGSPTTLTYTVTNTAELASKGDWSFTNRLPAGLVVAPTPGVGGTCTSSTGAAFAVTAAAGSSTVVAAGGDLVSGAASCTVTVNVIAAAAGTYTNEADDVTTLLVAPDAATVTVTPPSTLTVRKNITARNAPADQFVLSVRSGTTVLASATTAGTAVGVQPAQISRTTVEPGATYTIHEAATSGAGLTYASSYECLRGGTVVAAGASPSGTITMPADQGAEIVCTFTNAPQTPRLACDTNHFYTITQTGALVQGDTVSGATAAVGGWANTTTANALGIGTGGTLAYALQRSTDATDVAGILKWTPAGGFQSLAGSAYTTTANGTQIGGSIVAGAVDPAGRYVFGKFANSQFYLWRYTEANPVASRFAFVGSFPTGAAPDGNGDLAFDARGNLYVVGSATVNNASSAAIYTVTAETLAAASGGTLAAGTSTTRTLAGLDATPGFGAVNGITFSPRGTAYLSSATSAYEFDATTWTRIPGTPRVPIADATDMGGCTSPSTVTVLKNVVGRIAAADQFAVTLANGPATVATATTAGSATGRQAAQVGPFPVPLGTTMTVSEAMAPGSTSAITAYTTVYECWSGGVRLSTGTTASGTVTVPNQLSVNVVCTFFNSPRPASTVRITKLLQDASGATRPAAGWTVGVTATATAGTATALPSEAPRQVTDAAGQATWSVLFGSTASRATIGILEVQQSDFEFVRGSCTVNGTARAVTFGQSGTIISGSLADIASAATVDCTFVNRPVPTLTLVKSVGFGVASPSLWTLRATAPAGALPGPVGVTGGSQTTAVPVTAGAAYRLSESGGPLTYVQSGTWRCATAAGQTVAVTAAGDVTVAPATAVTCTVTNATASLTLVKQVDGARAGFQPTDWQLIATPAAIAGGSLPTETRTGAAYSASAGNAANTFEVRPGHSYTLSEAVTDPTRPLAYRQVRLERLDGSTWVPVSSPTVTAPAAGQSAVYRFVNAPVTPTTLPLTGGPSTDSFLIAGTAVLTLALVLAIIHSWRRTRRSRP